MYNMFMHISIFISIFISISISIYIYIYIYIYACACLLRLYLCMYIWILCLNVYIQALGLQTSMYENSYFVLIVLYLMYIQKKTKKVQKKISLEKANILSISIYFFMRQRYFPFAYIFQTGYILLSIIKIFLSDHLILISIYVF